PAGFLHVVGESRPLQGRAAVGATCVDVFGHVRQCRRGRSEDGGRDCGRHCMPGLSQHVQTSLIAPVESPNFSMLTPARCAMVSRMFACGVSLGMARCWPPLIPPPLPAISCGRGLLLCRSLLAMFEPNRMIELSSMLPSPSFISVRRLAKRANRSVW